MDQKASPSALSRNSATHSLTSSMLGTKPAPTGTTPISVMLWSSLEIHAAPLILSVTAETQYCDGLRGPLVIYDDNDPYRNDYDGGHILICSIISVQPVFPAVDNEDTIITLADW